MHFDNTCHCQYVTGIISELYIMKIEKLNLNGIKNALSRTELKKIMAGSGGGGGSILCCQCGIPCTNGVIRYVCFQGADTNNCSTYCEENGYPIGYPDCPLNCWSLDN